MNSSGLCPRLSLGGVGSPPRVVLNVMGLMSLSRSVVTSALGTWTRLDDSVLGKARDATGVKFGKGL